MTIPASEGSKKTAVPRPAAVRHAGRRRTIKKRAFGAAVKAAPLPLLSRLLKQLQALSLPQIASWELEAGIDAAGDQALWAWGTVVSQNIDPNDLRRISRTVQETLVQAAKDDFSWVYVRFRDPVGG